MMGVQKCRSRNFRFQSYKSFLLKVGQVEDSWVYGLVWFLWAEQVICHTEKLRNLRFGIVFTDISMENQENLLRITCQKKRMIRRREKQCTNFLLHSFYYDNNFLLIRIFSCLLYWPFAFVLLVRCMCTCYFLKVRNERAGYTHFRLKIKLNNVIKILQKLTVLVFLQIYFLINQIIFKIKFLKRLGRVL